VLVRTTYAYGPLLIYRQLGTSTADFSRPHAHCRTSHVISGSAYPRIMHAPRPVFRPFPPICCAPGLSAFYQGSRASCRVPVVRRGHYYRACAKLLFSFPLFLSTAPETPSTFLTFLLLLSRLHRHCKLAIRCCSLSCRLMKISVPPKSSALHSHGLLASLRILCAAIRWRCSYAKRTPLVCPKRQPSSRDQRKSLEKRGIIPKNLNRPPPLTSLPSSLPFSSPIPSAPLPRHPR
jgi:hypothetical protein